MFRLEPDQFPHPVYKPLPQRLRLTDAIQSLLEHRIRKCLGNEFLGVFQTVMSGKRRLSLGQHLLDLRPILRVGPQPIDRRGVHQLM